MNLRTIISHLPIVMLALLCIVFIEFMHQVSKDQISENKKRAALADINTVIMQPYDNDIVSDTAIINVPKTINPSGKINIHYARQGKEIVAMSLLPVIAKGYSGPINMLLGMTVEGSISSVRIISHSETPGFGAEIHQDKSNWLQIFNQQSLASLPQQKWATANDGGEYDRLSGATITSRAIINTLLELLLHYQESPEQFLPMGSQ